MPDEDPFERQIQHQEHLQRVVDLAEDLYVARAATDPGLRAFAELEGNLLGQTAQESLSDEIPSESSQAEFEWGFAKLIFAFTNPDDHTETISHAAFIDLLAELINERNGRSAPVIANHFKLLAAHLLVIRFSQLESGTAAGGSADEALEATYEYFRHSLLEAGFGGNKPDGND